MAYRAELSLRIVWSLFSIVSHVTRCEGDFRRELCLGFSRLAVELDLIYMKNIAWAEFTCQHIVASLELEVESCICWLSRLLTLLVKWLKLLVLTFL